MVKNFIVAITLTIAANMTLSAQENEIYRIPRVGIDTNQKVYSQSNTRFWIAAEVLAGYSIRPYYHNFGLGEFDVTAGYRFNEFIKIGAGLGLRGYFLQSDVRRHSSIFGMPLYFAARGNFMGSKYRSVVPYWGIESGVSLADGFMVRPTVGLRFGDIRSCWTLALSYLGQNIDSTNSENHQTNRFVNFICLRTGFEF